MIATFSDKAPATIEFGRVVFGLAEYDRRISSVATALIDASSPEASSEAYAEWSALMNGRRELQDEFEELTQQYTVTNKGVIPTMLPRSGETMADAVARIRREKQIRRQNALDEYNECFCLGR